MAVRFNPPPNWPPAPSGWSPPPGWQPDPAWGPPPPGWPLWETYRANRGAWGWAFLFAGAFFVVFLALGAAINGGVDAETTGELLAPWLVSGVVVGLAAWLWRSRWPVWVYPLVVLGVGLLLRALSLAGQAQS